MANKGNSKNKINPALEAVRLAKIDLIKNPLFEPLMYSTYSYDSKEKHPTRWARCSSEGRIYLNSLRRAEPETWKYVLAHCLLHYGLGHFKSDKPYSKERNLACCLEVTRFLNDLKIGIPVPEMPTKEDWPSGNEEKVYSDLIEDGISPLLSGLGMGGLYEGDMVLVPQTVGTWVTRGGNWEEQLAIGLEAAIENAMEIASGRITTTLQPKNTQAQAAKDWFVNSYPLLGALASTFKLIEDPQICILLQISTAAISAESKEIYINPAAGLGGEELRFVMAHEFLHVALRHHARGESRDPYLWNIACDYVINDWLKEMNLGNMPDDCLWDKSLRGFSAESVYDTIVKDLRRHRRLGTFRGYGKGDILEPEEASWWNRGAGLELDELYRQLLAQGLIWHFEQDRGFIPAGMVEEIRSLTHPAIAWDVQLAQWFEEHFPIPEQRRTYARSSRRQSSTPDIPRPAWYQPEFEDGRTFGVVLDTSGSMDRVLLGKALGAIASYSVERQVPFVRLVFCDADAYDQGYVEPLDIAENVKVKGRGGTILQPGIDLLQKSEDFPEKGPILIITDTYCDVLKIKREHAFLIPEGKSLPFSPKGPTFKIS